MIPNTKMGEMTDEQCGAIIRLSDEIGEFDKAIEWIKSYRSEKDADEKLDYIKARIELAGHPFGETLISKL